jgi:hypothetical protein
MLPLRLPSSQCLKAFLPDARRDESLSVSPCTPAGRFPLRGPAGIAPRITGDRVILWHGSHSPPVQSGSLSRTSERG